MSTFLRALRTKFEVFEQRFENRAFERLRNGSFRSISDAATSENSPVNAQKRFRSNASKTRNAAAFRDARKALSCKGIVFTLMSVLIALSLFSLLTNYRLFVSELGAATQQDVGIPQTFLYVGSHIQKMADMEVRTTYNKSHTLINFTDRAPRTFQYNTSLVAYKALMTDQMNLSYTIDFNTTIPFNQSAFEILGMNAQYNYSNFSKGNISILQREVNTNFVKAYEVRVAPLTDGVTVDQISTVTQNADTGGLQIFISAGDSTVNTKVSRTAASVYAVRFTGSTNTVNITVGLVAGYNSSLKIDPAEKSWINTTIIAQTNQLPK